MNGEYTMRTKFAKLAQAAGIVLALAFTFGCSGGDDGGEDKPQNTQIKKEKITGISQKGPFVNSIVTLYELGANMKRTSKTFTGTTDETGSFEIPINAELASPFVSLEVNGKYKNEVNDGSESDGAIILKAIASVKNKNTVNINALTHFEYEKVLALVSQGKTFEDAKAAAQKEVLSKFGLQGNSKNSEDMTLTDPVLFTVSVILGIYASTKAELEYLLADVGRVNAAVQNSNTDLATAETLFNKAVTYVSSLYPNNPLNISFEQLKTTLEKLKTGDLSDWNGGCELDQIVYYCMEFKSAAEMACELMRKEIPTLEGLGEFRLVKSCPAPTNATYCFEGDGCTMNGCYFSPPACKGQTLTRKQCEEKAEAIFSCK